MIPSSGVPYISFWQIDALAKAEISTSGMFAIQVAMTRLKPGCTTTDVPQGWIAKKTRQHRNSVSAAFVTAEAAGLIRKVEKQQPGRGRSAIWDFAPLLELHQEAQERK